MEVIALLEVETIAEAASANEQAVAESKELPKPPVPSATGNLHITVFKHDLIDAVVDLLDDRVNAPAGIELAIGNVSDTSIATAIFEAVFYDGQGNILETVKHREVDLPSGTSRAILIKSLQYESNQVQSYAVRLLRTSTVDVEKVQFRRHAINTTKAGDAVIQGIVKNICNVKVDAAIIVTFYDTDKETIGTRAVVLKDIEPGTVRQYELKFKPQAGDLVGGYGVAIGEIAT